jgi:hypothetical protein
VLDSLAEPGEGEVERLAGSLKEDRIGGLQLARPQRIRIISRAVAFGANHLSELVGKDAGQRRLIAGRVPIHAKEPADGLLALSLAVENAHGGGEWASCGTGATSVTLTDENRRGTLALMTDEPAQDLARAGWPSWQRRYWVSEHNLEVVLANIIHQCREIPLYTVDPNPTTPKIVEANATALARRIAPALIAHLEPHQDACRRALMTACRAGFRP